MKLNEIKIGVPIFMGLIVKSAQTKFTKAKKPYLAMELSDGMSTISANDWDYGDKPAPLPNTILDIGAEVSEYLGAKQLKITQMSPNTTLTVADFSPRSDMDIPEYLTKFKMLASKINSVEANLIALNALADTEALWLTIPAAKSIHHAFVAGNLKHSVDTAYKALALGQLTTGCNEDLCILGGLLHDFGKLWAYALDGAVIDYTVEGNLLDHIPMGIGKVEKYRTPLNTKIIDLLQHVIASHHGELEYGSPVTPRFLEAWLIHLADMADAKAETIKELNERVPKGSMYTEKEWTLGNRQMLTQEYINTVMAGYSE